MRDPVLGQLLAELRAAGGTDPVDLVRGLCARVPANVAVSGAAITVITEGASAVVAASDAAARELEDLQVVLHEGPGLDAYASQRAVLVADLGLAARWTAYSAAAERQGACAVFSFPLQLGAIRVGALTLHRRAPGELAADHLNLAYGVAELATWLLVSGQSRSDGTDLAMGWAALDGDWTVVHQATGMVSAQLSVPVPEALVRLRARAFADDRTVTAVAHDVVERRLRLERDPPPTPQ